MVTGPPGSAVAGDPVAVPVQMGGVPGLTPVVPVPMTACAGVRVIPPGLVREGMTPGPGGPLCGRVEDLVGYERNGPVTS